MAVSAEEWLALLEREYLAEYITAGGAAVKFVIGSAEEMVLVQQYLREAAGRHDMVFASVDAATSRLHMIQDVFFAVARALDWNGLARRFLETLFTNNGYTWPEPGCPIPMQDLAVANAIDIAFLGRRIDQWLTQEIMQDNTMTHDFRLAMSELCRLQMEAPSSGAAIEAPIIQWLTGTLRAISALKSAQITAKITRYNGRAVLRSACQWLRKSGKRGLCVTLDIRQLGRVGKSAETRVRYSPGAVMDGFEVLRQLIDDAEQFAGMLVVALADDSLIGVDRRRSLDAYLALKMRVWSDVRPEGRDDPLAPLVSLVSAQRDARAAAEVSS